MVGVGIGPARRDGVVALATSPQVTTGIPECRYPAGTQRARCLHSHNTAAARYAPAYGILDHRTYHTGQLPTARSYITVSLTGKFQQHHLGVCYRTHTPGLAATRSSTLLFHPR